ncbi:MAG: A/G-specific adenine glycosylase, partial [Candidatus Omnitrophica bacterium]|nr:A/G-specific adenine glycosylase [Candidatus Omnitrophota bacterium]
MPIQTTKRNRIRKNLLGWFVERQRDLPWRRNTDPYSILVSEIMLQQTQVETVIPYYLRFMEAFPDFETLASAEEEKVLGLW